MPKLQESYGITTKVPIKLPTTTLVTSSHKVFTPTSQQILLYVKRPLKQMHSTQVIQQYRLVMKRRYKKHKLNTPTTHQTS